MKKHKFTNQLIYESSPYLRQHAHNPVNWFPWGKTALEKAVLENKPLLISIGYSACHWCHVMEHESFEDQKVAELMNNNFVCIKVDREERPDIDQIYMNAMQLMTYRGGWPLNCFALPDGKPFYGGTYFPMETWIDILEKIIYQFKVNNQKVQEYAEKLTEGIRLSELIKPIEENKMFFDGLIEETVKNWKTYFDVLEGGPNRAPKFPLPNNYQFLLRYVNYLESGIGKKNPSEINGKSELDEIMKHIKLTLDKMAYGGIYDQIGGGFCRYSVDSHWKVPHFEKMLYDNGQLVSLYSEAFQITHNPLYKEIVFDTLDFVIRELGADNGSFYSSLDADSEGREGKFYVWKKEELEGILGDDFLIMSDYFNINRNGFWEEENYILLRKKSDIDISSNHNIGIDKLNEIILRSKQKLFAARGKKIRPALDDKTLTSWNAIMLKGFVDAYLVFGENKFLEIAKKNAGFILNSLKKNDGGLWHNFKGGRSSINGFLEDYCFTIEAFISLYEATFDEQWLEYSKQFAEYCFKHFYDSNTKMFFFTSDEDEKLIARKTELTDNVIPASCSSLAKGLFLLGRFFSDEKYLDVSSQMLRNIQKLIPLNGSSYSNWGQLLLWNVNSFFEIGIFGAEADKKRNELNRHFIPNKFIVGGKTNPAVNAKTKQASSLLSKHENKFAEGKTMIYVCQNKICYSPVTEISEALNLIKKK